MSNSSQEFNLKYRLTQEDLKLLKVSPNHFNSFQITGKVSELWKDTLKNFFKTPLALIATIVFILLLLTAIFTAAFSPFYTTKPISGVDNELVFSQKPGTWGVFENNISQDLLDKILSKSTPQHPLIHGVVEEIVPGRYLANFNPYEVISALANKQIFSIVGTDEFGRDIWLRTWVGTLNALGISAIIAVIESVIGVLLGTYLGYHIGKWIDNIFLRIIDVFNSIPWIVIFVIFIGIFGPKTIVIIILLTATGWTGPTYLARSYTIIIKDEEYIQAAKAVGASKLRQIYSHILLNILGKLLSGFVSRLLSAISIIAGLAFLGFLKESADSPANLGLIINSSRQLADSNIWALLFPSFILVILALSTRFIANGIHDALDPRIGGRK
ncbi:ABC transporter permease [Mycoplasma hyorhinis]|uniref:ABC transporter permease n=1 Tax=Mesomycoplasma hyorhinis TaxID=2100 RepID=UPI001368EED5|nr:ABC transporter permease [Mesomycoplasma hyorhinis]MXR07701.1 ABC transporter permease [Mesomycoplasma hyorhinis]